MHKIIQRKLKIILRQARQIARASGKKQRVLHERRPLASPCHSRRENIIKNCELFRQENYMETWGRSVKKTYFNLIFIHFLSIHSYPG